MLLAIAEVKKTSLSTDVVEEDLDLKAVMVDGIFAKVHQHGTGAKKSAARLTSRLIDKLSAVVVFGLYHKAHGHVSTRPEDWSAEAPDDCPLYVEQVASQANSIV